MSCESGEGPPSPPLRGPGAQVPWLVLWAVVAGALLPQGRGDERPGTGGSANRLAGDWESAASEGDDSRALYESQTAQRARLTPYEETIPTFILPGERRRLDLAFQIAPSRYLRCTVYTEGRPLVLDLELNENLLSGPHHLMYYLPNGTLVTDEDSDPINCYYHGVVEGFPDSSVSVSVCPGLRGLIRLSGNQSYGIEPLVGDKEQVHLIHRIEPAHYKTKRCAVSPISQEHTAQLEDEIHHRRPKRDVLTDTKYIELVMIADNKEFRGSGYDLKSLQLRLLEIANQVDAFYRPLNIRVALVGVEVWTKRDPFQILNSPSDTLKRFLKWREEDLLPRLPHDNAQLLIGGTFTGSTVGMASQGSMCSRDRSGGVNVDHSVSVLGVASTVAHELGHNLGINHDTIDRKCVCHNPKRLGGCIMEAATGFLPGQAFSSCSEDDLERNLRHGGAMCLLNFPASERLFGGQRCGNLYVERDEECDCGLADECDDPCCNATSCKLVPGAECSSEGACCANCKLKPAATLCRPPLGDCDLPEYCTGSSPYCPPNVFLKNGHTCDEAKAYCYNGACLTYELQCQVLWGPGSVQAHDICFALVNKKGDKYGNCGELPDGTFMSCSAEDAKCGKIQCQGGNDRPILGSSAEVLVTTIKVGQEEYSCRRTFFNFGDDIADPAMVMPGTACGKNKACVNRTCQDISIFKVDECLQKCHNHGICNSNDNCHCDTGWAPPHCQSAGYGGSLDSGPVQQPGGKSALLITLLVIFLLFVAVVCFCYIKRDQLRAKIQKLGKGSPQRHSATGGYRLGALREREAREEERDSQMENGFRPPSANRLHSKPPGSLQQTELRPPQSIKSAPPSSPSRPTPPTKALPPDPVVKASQARRQGLPGRPPPPSTPLPADPVPKSGQPPLPRKPPPPKKALPTDPGARATSGTAAAQPEHPRVSFYAEQDSRPPTRPAPPPPGKKPPLPPLPFVNA